MSKTLSPIADSLVLVFTRGVSLQDWQRLGLLDREWALYDRLRDAYGRMVLVTHGDAGDLEIGRSLGDHVDVVCNEESLETICFEAKAPERCARLVAGSSTAVVKTNQMKGGTLGVAVTRELRKRSIRTALIARGGYLWSRFEAAEHGSGSNQAMEAGDQERELCMNADLIIGTSIAMVGDLSWRYAIDRDRVRLIPNYVLGDVGPRGSADRDGKTVLYAGQLVSRKRVHLIVEGVAQVKAIAQRDARLSIIGEGPEQHRLEELAASLGVDATFEPRLPHRELLERMASCAVYVQASELEGHPKTVIEAMSTGAPVVVTAAPGLGGIVDHGSTGLVFPPVASALARGVAGMLDDPQWAEAIGEAAAAGARSKYGLDRIAPMEHEAHAEAMRLAGKGAQTIGAPVRWEPALLDASCEHQVQSWERSLRGFARRLADEDAGRFLMALDSEVYRLQGETSVRAGRGLHPKHELIDYHQFFAGRVQRGDRVADLGCGVGALACAIARAGASVVGMEISDDHAAQATARIEREGLVGSTRIIVGDICECRLEGTFDVLVISNVLEHLRDRPALLRRWMSWYSPKKVLVRVPAFDRDWRAAWKKDLGVEWRLDPTHETEYTRDELEAELGEAGLRAHELITRWGEYWVDARPA
jgi:glycosyltransferase involved in cell wall biosynthesis/2-polyprenyl-3-methyl-5-hydroxy-6-metoxy-1,4-benzoquinol methylase